MLDRLRLADRRTPRGPGSMTGRTVALAAPSSPKYTFTTSPETETVR